MSSLRKRLPLGQHSGTRGKRRRNTKIIRPQPLGHSQVAKIIIVSHDIRFIVELGRGSGGGGVVVELFKAGTLAPRRLNSISLKTIYYQKSQNINRLRIHFQVSSPPHLIHFLCFSPIFCQDHFVPALPLPPRITSRFVVNICFGK